MEELGLWIPAISTTSLLGGLLWLGRSLIITRLKNSVKHEFDGKLEFIRSELKFKEAQIESLRTGAMSGLITRQGALYQRKIQAIDQIWSSVKELEKGKYISITLGTLNIEECIKQSGRDPSFTDFINKISGNFNLIDLDVSGSKLARPFLTPLAWAYYSAYSTVITQASVITNILKIGIKNPEKFLKLENSSSLLKAVLPSWSDYIDAHGISGHHHLLDEIEKLLLAELKNIQDGHEDDKENTIRAAKINQEIEKVSNDIAEFQASAQD
ncbi:conserved hypothetical protein [Pseudomonas sp. 9AZ]|uniref:hypothetical protein n=1 Tax=Pseudomonas sp. 9AZ TaxID=2653168 RepID=UPI0012F28DE1|nr:hypothetical protein [Pseudomonas sp. 9AZ]VXD03398.1 conserved hypothetical protein [Pseudomonas sp. 9AZ]